MYPCVAPIKIKYKNTRDKMSRLLENIHKITATTDTTPITKGFR